MILQVVLTWSMWSMWASNHGCCGAGIVRANMPCFLANIGAGAWLWPPKNRQPGVFRPESHEFLSQNLYPESTSDFVRSNITFFEGETWAVSGKFGVVVGIMFENSVSWPSVWVLQHCGGELEEALAGHSEGTLSWMCHEQLMIVAVQDNWNCSYMSMVHCFRQWSATVLYYYIILILLYCIVLYCTILYYIILCVIYIYYWVYWSDLNCTTWLSEGAVQILDLFFQWLLQNGSLTSVGFVSQLQGFVPNYIYMMIEEKGRIGKYYNNDNDHYKWWWLQTHTYI